MKSILVDAVNKARKLPLVAENGILITDEILLKKYFKKSSRKTPPAFLHTFISLLHYFLLFQ
ncbi:hypothetical protein BCI9360_02138 [Bacillus sp. CECT 9360]|nr:hypothetical protein BCI9360_02138 [Bacillus sp. CECT 9360]